MKRNAFWILIAMLLIVGAAMYRLRVFLPKEPAAPSSNYTAPHKELVTYRNDVYGFTLEYPDTLLVKNSFELLPTAQNTWRVNGDTNGIAVVEIPIKFIDRGGIATGKPYPLFYAAEVRVGVSHDTGHCFDTDPGFAAQKVQDVALGGVMFKRFEFADAAMMKYLKGVSYRAIRNGKCYAVEQLASGSSYRDPTMNGGYSDAELDDFYRQAGVIAESFRFIP